MRNRLANLLAACSALISVHAAALPIEIANLPGEQRLVGKSEFQFLFWHFFDAALWTPDGQFDWRQPMTLSLVYRTDFSAEDLTDSTIEEMARVSDWSEERLATFRTEVAPCMTDVDEGDRFTAHSPSTDEIVLYLNGQERCRWQAPGLRQAYIGIWLSERSRFPEKSARLMGRAP